MMKDVGSTFGRGKEGAPFSYLEGDPPAGRAVSARREAAPPPTDCPARWVDGGPSGGEGGSPHLVELLMGHVRHWERLGKNEQLECEGSSS